ncbi:GNAT family N-acetyltransferase [Vibrio rumoiensis]|uniref:GNAT family N-acetyltransferase n=1 Tax=Vibrio rumoiensis 1S-45 TaxID=1188252 RepID=A0A1E5E179_9VIBR|nr:GNAT family N-acetyltransferase [Vibrio rumoiensis]OEF24361.1 GNAT family N-acetyltransferase [Vibrio rumoiensis 1S-45]
MNELIFQQLDPIKLPLIKPIYKAFYPSAKPKKNEAIIVGYAESNIVAIVRFRPIGEYSLLTGMLVIPSFRHSGIATDLLTFCKTQHLNSSCFCFAYTHLKNFYKKAGFEVKTIVELPPPLQQLFQRYTSNGKNLLPMQYKCTDMT